MAYRVCTKAGCPELVEGGGRCGTHRAEADRGRGTASERGYTSAGHQRFRDQVLLLNDGVCTHCQLAPATVADHWPRSRRELIAAGLNPNDPRHGRPLCAPCHGSETARLQPGGWHSGSS